MELLIATQNPGKFQELKEGLLHGLHPDLAKSVKFYSPADLDIHEDCEEGEESFEDNAMLKARFYARRAKGMLTLADDSGIQVEALEGELGVTTRRWGAGHDASDEAWLDFFLNRMKTESNKAARFVCAIALYQELDVDVLGQLDGLSSEEAMPFQAIFLGESRGQICESPQTAIEPGIPLSSVFLPEEYDKVYSALSVDEKNKVSHRGRALQQVVQFLNSHTL